MGIGRLLRLAMSFRAAIGRFAALVGPLAPVGCLHGVKPTFHLMAVTTPLRREKSA